MAISSMLNNPYLNPVDRMRLESYVKLARQNPGFQATTTGISRIPNYVSPQQQAAQQAQVRQLLVGTGQGPTPVTQQYYQQALMQAPNDAARARIRSTLAPTAPSTNQWVSGVSMGQDGVQIPSAATSSNAPAFRSLSQVQQQASQGLGRTAAEYMGAEPTAQQRTLQQAESLLRNSGVETAERRYAELEQIFQQMPYAQRLNQPEVVRGIQQEMEQLQKKIQDAYANSQKYIQTQMTTERRMEEERRNRPTGGQYYAGGDSTFTNRNDLQGLAARGFYQTPYAYQNA